MDNCELELIEQQPREVSQYVVYALAAVNPFLSLVKAAGIRWFPIRPGSKRLDQLVKTQLARVEEEIARELSEIAVVETSNTTSMDDVALEDKTDISLPDQSIKQRPHFSRDYWDGIPQQQD